MAKQLLLKDNEPEKAVKLRQMGFVVYWTLRGKHEQIHVEKAPKGARFQRGWFAPKAED